MRHALRLPRLIILLTVFGIWTSGPVAFAVPPSDWSSFAGDGDFVLEKQGLELVDDVNNIRVDWKNPTHTGHGKGSAGALIELHKAGFDPAFGETANTIVADGIVFVSWSQPSGDVQVPRSKIDHRYYSEEEKKKVPDSFWRIDADWRTIAIDADTGKTLWQAREKSASRHFLCTKHTHPGGWVVTNTSPTTRITTDGCICAATSASMPWTCGSHGTRWPG